MGVAGCVNRMKEKYAAKYLIRWDPLAGGFLMSLLDCGNDFSNTLSEKIRTKTVGGKRGQTVKNKRK